MPLRAQYDNQTEIPDGFSSLYTEVDGKWNIEAIDGLVSATERDTLLTSLNASRNDTKAVKSELKQWKSLGEDLGSVQSLLDRVPELELAATGSNPEDVQNRIDAAATARVAPVQRQLNELQEKYNEAQQAVEQFQIADRKRKMTDIIRTELQKSGITDPAALDVAIQQGLSVSQLNDDGSVTTSDKYNTPGLRPEVWVKDLQKSHSFLWPDSISGGARGGIGSLAGGENPWVTGDISKQSKLMVSDMDLAKQYYKQAGDKAKGLNPAVA